MSSVQVPRYCPKSIMVSQQFRRLAPLDCSVTNSVTRSRVLLRPLKVALRLQRSPSHQLVSPPLVRSVLLPNYRVSESQAAPAPARSAASARKIASRSLASGPALNLVRSPSNSQWPFPASLGPLQPV